MNIVVVDAPELLPCPLDMAMRYIKATEADVDAVELACRAATAACEDYTGRVFQQTIFKATLSAWPTLCRPPGIAGPRANSGVLPGITLPRSPLVAINSLKYYPDGGGAQVEWDDANYYSDRAALPGRLVFVDGVDLPALAVRPDAIEIEFEAGHGTTMQEMPANYLTAMLQLARHFFDNPGVLDHEGKGQVMPFSFQHLFRSQRI